MKRILSVVLVMLLCIGLMPSTAKAATNISKAKATMEVDSTLKLKINESKNKTTWKSNKSSIASVKSDGTVTAKKEGQAVITATVSGKKYTCTVTVVDSNKASEEKSLSGLVKFLKDEKLLNGSETKMDASMIGGKSGVKYKDSKIELYVFDTSSKEYESISKTKKVTLSGFNIELTVSAVNGEFVLFCEEAANKDDIIEAFMKY